MKGSITLIDPMNFNSGPGIRVYIKMDEETNIELTPNETVDRIRKFRPYFGPDGGGVTFAGTKIFDQGSYLIETCHISHKAGITTCIETDGMAYQDIEDFFKYIDLVIIDIVSLPLYNYGHLDNDILMNINKLMNKLEENKIDIWIKQQIHKGVNDNEEYIHCLRKYLGMFSNIKDVELTSNDVESNTLDKLREVFVNN